MMPIHATVAVLTALFAWNDFMLPLVLLSDSSMYTLPLVQHAFQGEFSTNYNLAFASYLMAMLPMIIVYVFAQKWIISGVMRGSRSEERRVGREWGLTWGAAPSEKK